MDPAPTMTVSEFHLAAPDGHLYTLDSPRFQSFLLRIGDLLVRADLTQPIRLPAHDRAADPGQVAPSSTPIPASERIWSGHVIVEPHARSPQKPLWKASFRGPREQVAEQMTLAILTQLRTRLRPPVAA